MMNLRVCDASLMRETAGRAFVSSSLSASSVWVRLPERVNPKPLSKIQDNFIAAPSSVVAHYGPTQSEGKVVE